MTITLFVCPKAVLGPGTVCCDGIPEDNEGGSPTIDGRRIKCRAWKSGWQDLDGHHPGFCKLIDGIVLCDTECEEESKHG